MRRWLCDDICLAVLIELQLVTDGRTDGQDHGVYRAIVSREKGVENFPGNFVDGHRPCDKEFMGDQ